MQCIIALHCSPSVSFIVGSIHFKVCKVAHYTSFSKLSPQSDDVSQTSDSTRRSLDSDDCLLDVYLCSSQPPCSLTSAPRPRFVPTLCPVESLAPAFSNHNCIPAERRQQQSKYRHSLKGTRLPAEICDSFLTRTFCCI